MRQSPTAECSKEAVAAMKLLELRFEMGTIDVQVDLTFPQRGERGCHDGPCVQHPGPVTSVVVEGSGELVKGTLLTGRVFDHKYRTGKQWVYRWTEATLPNGDKYPVCIEEGSSRGTCPDGSKNRACAVLHAGPVKQWDIDIIP